jgi:hypothetical protein
MSELGQYLPTPEAPATSDVPPMATEITDITDQPIRQSEGRAYCTAQKIRRRLALATALETSPHLYPSQGEPLDADLPGDRHFIWLHHIKRLRFCPHVSSLLS